jgi:hypothetical protein
MMMPKKLTIYQENNPPITLIDDDESSLEDYSKSLSKFISLNNISILETSHSVLVTRPSKISSILVDNIDFSAKEEEKKLKISIPGKKKVVKKKKEQVDIITDAN